MNKKLFVARRVNKLIQELEYLKNDRRKEISQKIREAKEFGDLLKMLNIMKQKAIKLL